MPAGIRKDAASAPDRAKDPAGAAALAEALVAEEVVVLAAIAGAPASAIAAVAAKAPASRRLDK
jgi:hypothetical protein